MWGLGIFLSYQVVHAIFKTEGKTEREFNTLALFIILGTLIGARVAHILFYDPIHYWQNPIEILPIKIKGGFEFVGFAGLASHGGIAGILLAMALYCKRYTTNYLWLADRLSIVAMLSGGFIRLGNLFNSEIIGLPTKAPWAFIFVKIDQLPRHPAQLYEALFYFIMFFVLWWFYKRSKLYRTKGLIVSLSLIVLFTFRFLVEFVKVDQELLDYGLNINMGQLLSLPFIIIGIVMLIIFTGRRGSKLPL